MPSCCRKAVLTLHWGSRVPRTSGGVATRQICHLPHVAQPERHHAQARAILVVVIRRFSPYIGARKFLGRQVWPALRRPHARLLGLRCLGLSASSRAVHITRGEERNKGEAGEASNVRRARRGAKGRGSFLLLQNRLIFAKYMTLYPTCQ